MSCGSGNCEIPYNFNTDHPGVLSCNRNNCRCGGDGTGVCMYYNRPDGAKAHYNYFAVQGSGDPNDPKYRCTNKAFDFYNDEGMYGDHALGGLGTYTQAYGEHNQSGLYGTVKYDDKNCSEHPIGQLDMCDECDKDHPDFYSGSHLGCCGDKDEVDGLMSIPDLIDGDQDFDLGLTLGDYYFGVEMQRWLLLVVVVAMLWWMRSRRMLPRTLSSALGTRVLGFTVMNGLIALAVLYFGAFFF